MKAIQTRYNGCYFRSRLEARWAVFFDKLGIEWAYEPEGFEINGFKYLPDFYLPDYETYVEVRPKMGSFTGGDLIPTDSKEYEFSQFCSASDKYGYWYIVGQPGVVYHHGSVGLQGDIRIPEDLDVSKSSYAIQTETDNGYYFCSCDLCGATGVAYEGRAERLIHAPCCTAAFWKKYYNANSIVILSAAMAAKSARFEFGEHGYKEQDK